jgi:hypothetical protein
VPFPGVSRAPEVAAKKLPAHSHRLQKQKRLLVELLQGAAAVIAGTSVIAPDPCRMCSYVLAGGHGRTGCEAEPPAE